MRWSNGCSTKADASEAALLGVGGLLTEITRAVLERALEAETSEHLGCERGDSRRTPAGRRAHLRNGLRPSQHDVQENSTTSPSAPGPTCGQPRTRIRGDRGRPARGRHTASPADGPSPAPSAPIPAAVAGSGSRTGSPARAQRGSETVASKPPATTACCCPGVQCQRATAPSAANAAVAVVIVAAKATAPDLMQAR